MSPWWKRRLRKDKVCTRCQADTDVHDGLCRHCRMEVFGADGGGERRKGPRPGQHLPRQPSIEPAHDRPWVHQGGA
jgi:ribosomal protein L40E